MHCPRCNGTAIDPKHSAADGIDGPAYLEPCALCQYPVPEPNGCSVCGDPETSHGWQFDSEAGMHQWIRPTLGQIKERMLARRAARLTAPTPKYHATTGWAPDATGESGEPYCWDCGTDGCRPWIRIQARLDRIRWGIPAKHPKNALPGSWGGIPLPF
jgi:hypothetical protein